MEEDEAFIEAESGVNWATVQPTWAFENWQHELSVRDVSDVLDRAELRRLDSAVRAASLHPELARLLLVPEILVRRADSPRYLLPDGLHEQLDGLHGPHGKISTHWLRVVGLVETENGDLRREVAVATPVEDPWSRPNWQRLVVPAEAIASANAFNRELIRRSSARFFGGAEDLALLFAHESAFVPAREVLYLGRLLGHESKGLLLGDRAFAGDLHYDIGKGAGRVSWDNGRDLWLNFHSEGRRSFAGYPAFAVSRKALRDLLNGMYQAFGVGGLIALAFAAAGLTAPVARREHGAAFPHLLVVGLWRSGKSSLAGILRALFHLSGDIAVGTTSEAALGHILRQHVGIPAVIDDARPEFLRRHRALLLGGFSGTGRTVVHGGRSSEASPDWVDAAVVLISEFEPRDAALLSRCVRVNCSTDRHSPETRELMPKLSSLAAQATTALCLGVGQDQDERFLKRTKELATELELDDVRARTQTWPWIVGGLEFLLERAQVDDVTGARWLRELRDYASEVAGDPVEQSWSEQFLLDLCHMLSIGVLSNWERLFRLADSRLFVRFREVYGEWLRFRKSRSLSRPDSNENDLLDELEARGFLDATVERRQKQRIDGVSVRVVTILRPESDDDVRTELFDRLRQLAIS